MKRLAISIFAITFTLNAFSQWETIACELQGPTYLSIDAYSVVFTDTTNGLIAGSDWPLGLQPENGYILKTNTGGWSWDTVLYVDTMIFRKIILVDSLTLFAVGGVYPNRGVVAKSNDFGDTWNLTFFNDFLMSICFPDDTTGYISGFYGNVYKTIDSGNTWNNISVSPNTILTVIDFFDTQNGIASGDSVFFTHDGGATWTNFGIGNTIGWQSTDISIISGQTGYLGFSRKLYKTNNSGQSWDTIGYVVDSIYYYPIMSIFFPNDSIGYLASQHFFFKTTDGGYTWGIQAATIIGTFWDMFRDNYFLNADTGFMVGLQQFYKTFDGGGGIVSVKQNNIGEIYASIYPNPAINEINIDINNPRYSLIRITNINGTILVEKEVFNKTKIDINNFKSGLYLVTIITDQSVISGRFIKINN